MKTDVIHLESFDDIDSIRDRLEWSRAERVVLVWPRRGGIKARHLDMALLARKAVELGRHVAVVNGGDEVSRLAAAAGIPVFRSQASATLSRWPELTKVSIEPPSQSGLKGLREEIERIREAGQAAPRARLVPFAAGTAAVFALLLFFLPSATVRVFPEEVPQTVRISVQANSEIREADLAGFIPLRALTSLQTAAAQAGTSGRVPVADQFARGAVSLQNQTDRPFTLPEGSVVTTLTNPPVRFRILAGVELPAGGETIRGEIEAVLPGAEGNVPAGLIQSLEGPLGLDVAVLNEEPTSGGGETDLRSPSEDDIHTLREKVKSMLLAQGKEEFMKSPRPGQVLLEDSLKIEKIVDEHISTPAGQPADTLEVSLTGEIRMNTILEEDLRASCRAALDASLPPGYEPVDGEISLKMDREPRFDRSASAMTWEITVERMLRPAYTDRAIIQAVTGRRVDKAVELLYGMLNNRETPRIEMRPSWWPGLPFLPFRIVVEAG